MPRKTFQGLTKISEGLTKVSGGLTEVSAVLTEVFGGLTEVDRVDLIEKKAVIQVASGDFREDAGDLLNVHGRHP
jgi:hypothetical protein